MTPHAPPRRPFQDLVAAAIEGGHGAISSQPLAFLAVFALFVAAISFPSMQRPFWYDEIVTFHLAVLPGMTDIWRELRDGADLNPPFFYAATRFSHALLGPSEFSTRLPQLAGFLVMCFAIHAFVRRHGSESAAFAAMMFPLLTAAPEFAAEARPYGLVLGFSAIAAVAWQRAALGENRTMALPVLTLALLGALQSHCYAVVVLAAFYAAEAARSWITRRLDWPVVATIIIPSLSIGVYLLLLPSMAGDRSDLNPIFRTTPPESYRWLLAPGFLPVAAVLIVCALLSASLGGAPKERNESRAPLWEVVLAGCLSCAPVLVWIIQSAFTHIGYPRYGLPAVIGLSILFGLMAERCTSHRKESAFVVVLAILFVLLPLRFSPPADGMAPLPDAGQWLDAEPLPVVIANPLAFVELNRYGKDDLPARTVYLASADKARSYLGVGAVDKYFETKLRPNVPLRGRIVRPEEFLRSNRRFFVLSDFYADLEWLPKHLQREHRGVLYHGKVLFQGRALTLLEALPEP